jgi:hypothetical protein
MSTFNGLLRTNSALDNEFALGQIGSGQCALQAPKRIAHPIGQLSKIKSIRRTLASPDQAGSPPKSAWSINIRTKHLQLTNEACITQSGDGKWAAM